MPEILEIIPEGDGALEHLRGLLQAAKLTHVLALTGGMVGGRPSVAFVVQTDDGRAFLGETSLRLFLTAADALKAVHGDPRDDDDRGGGKA